MTQALLREEAVRALTGALGAGVPDAATVASALSPAKSAAHGDFAFPSFVLAKTLRKPPPAIAAELATAANARLGEGTVIQRVEAAGPFVNVFVAPEARARLTLEAIHAQGEGYGCSDAGGGQAVCVDFSSPNIAKPFGIGHLRSTVIGNAICNLYRACGWRPVGINHLGDWGKQFGMLMVALTEQGGEAELEQAAADGGVGGAMAKLYELYVRIHNDVEGDPGIEARAKDWFLRLEAGDADARRLWERCKEVSLAEFRRVYARLGMSESFEHWWGESHYEGEPMARVVRELDGGGLLAESDDARVVFLEEEELPPCLIVKADGATLYATRDLAGAIFRQEAESAARLVYVVGAEQTLHFRQIFRVLAKMGYPWAGECLHVPFGRIQGMSTRKGTMVLLDEVLGEAVARVARIVADRDYPEEERARIAEQVGVGAIIFADLSNQRIKDWDFDWGQLLNFNGRTGPYLQYGYVRTGGVLEKWGRPVAPEGVDWSKLCDDDAANLLRRLSAFPGVVARACEDHEPSVVSRYLLDLAEDNNRFYNARRVVDPDDPATSAARALLVQGVRTVLGNGLRLLGVALPERM